MPKLHSSGSVRAHPIPSTNPIKFADSLVPVYEMEKLTKQEVSELPCWTMYGIKPLESNYKENDILCEIFAEGPGINTDFM